MSYAKTEPGQTAFRERSALFSARQRAAYILFDGVKSVERVLEATVALGLTRGDIEHMVTHGFLAEKESAALSASAVVPPQAAMLASGDAPEAAPAPSPGMTTASISRLTPQERYSQARPLATQLTASLGLRGFILNLGVESASGYDDLLALFPKIQSAVGSQKCLELERVLKN